VPGPEHVATKFAKSCTIEVMADSIPDSWTPLDLPVLRVVARWHFNVTPERPPHLRPESVASDLGRDVDDVEVRGALTRLLSGDYIHGAAIDDEPYDYVMVLGITERGLRASGAWPSEDRVLEALAASFEDVATRLDEKGEPEKAGHVRQAIGWLADGVRTVGIDFLERYLAHLAGMG
jgi:hypothetical protein